MEKKPLILCYSIYNVQHEHISNVLLEDSMKVTHIQIQLTTINK